MTAPLRLASLLLALAAPAAAEEAPLASYWQNSGSLPPEYAWELTATISETGLLVLRHCKGYATEGPGCETREAQVDRPALDAILDAARASDLLANPAAEPEEPMVGGPGRGGAVWLDGGRLILPAQAAVSDEARVAHVLDTIAAAIPETLRQND